MKHYLFSLLFFSLATLAFAVPAAQVTISHTQSDGTELSLTLVGDEHLHYYINAATGEAMRQGADGDYYVITDAELQAQTANAATRRAQINQQRVARLPRMQEDINAPKRIGSIDNNLSGNKSVLVLLVAYSDKAFTGTQSDFNNQFNQQNYSANSHIGSVHDYFYDQSYGALNLSFDVYGPITLSNTMEYYGANDASGNDLRPRQMVKEAVQKANTSYDIDFTKYDWDNDGKVDQVVVIYAGYAESQGAPDNTIWPHQWELSGIGTLSGTAYDRKTINSYACLSELKGKTGSTRDGIGTFCHEFSHCLGLPDFYDTNYSTDGTANDMSYFDVMASGSYNGSNNAVPCGYTAYERWQFGWVTPTELSTAATITGMKPLNNANPDVYVIYNKRNRNEYFLLENRQSNSWFKYSSTYTAGHGLFITHCNYVASYWTNNTVNATAGDEHFVYVPANRSYSETSTNLPKAFFPTGATSFTDDSHTSCGGALWTNNTDGTKKLGVPITDIAESNGLISFDVLGGMHDDGSRYTITLNACGGSVSQTSWTQTTYKQTWSLPEPTTTVPGWSGIGWLTYELTTYKSLDEIIDNVIDYGEPYEPESDVKLYAVYSDNDEICHSRPANYTINFDAGAGSCATTSWSQNADNRSLALPTPTISIDGWTFAGWTTESIAETNTLPSFVTSPYHPTSNVTLHAVYQKTETATGDNVFRLSSTLTTGNRYVFVTSNTTGSAYAISKDNLQDITSTSGNTTTGAAITVTASKTVAPTDAMIWACTITNGEINLKNGTDYLGINGNGIGKRSTAVKLWWSSDNGLYGKNSAGTTSYYAKVNNSTIQTATTAPTTGRIYAYEAAAAGNDIITYNSNPQQGGNPEPGDGDDDDDEPGEDGDITITPISGIPAGYYNSTIVGKNDRTLELALKAIVGTHTKINYSSLWQAFETTDVVPTSLLKNPAKTDQVYDMYADINTFTKYYSDNDHSQTGGFNREHCVPNSWWGGESGNATAYTDLHHLVPSDGAANNAKSNHPLGEYKSGMTLNWPTETKTNSSGYTYVVADNTQDHSGSWSHVWKTSSNTFVFEPANEFKGDFARMYLYVVCAYEGDLTWQTSDNKMFSNDSRNNNYTVITNDAKALLLKWHRQDPVSDKERMRNNAVQSIQGNRNPFIDYPILVEYIWGDSIAKTSFSLETMPSAYQFVVTYHVGPNVTCSEQVRLCDRGSNVTLPTATTTVEGWTFSGWATSAIENTTTAPSLLTGSYKPTENVDLYAVFQAGGTYSITPEELESPEPDPETPSPTALYFPHIAKLGQPFTAPAFNTNSDGAQTWTSSNTDVAEVDNEGHVTIKAVGTTIITVTQAETATYTQASASYMIKVVE